MRFPTMWYVRPAQPQISLRLRAASDQSLCWLLEISMTVKLLTEHHLEFLNLKGDCAGSSESTLVKMPYCWKSLDMAQLKKTPMGAMTTKYNTAATYTVNSKVFAIKTRHTITAFSRRSHGVEEKYRTPRCANYDRKHHRSNAVASPVVGPRIELLTTARTLSSRRSAFK